MYSLYILFFDVTKTPSVKRARCCGWGIFPDLSFDSAAAKLHRAKDGTGVKVF